MKMQGIILAGGKSSRMGQDKGLLMLHGKTFVEHIIQTVQPLVENLLIVGQNRAYEQFSLPVVADIFHEGGPAGGIYTGLHYSKHPYNLIISCDTPLIRKDLITDLINNYQNEEAFFYKEDARLHPLLGIYKGSAKSHFKKSLELGEFKLSVIMAGLKFNTLNTKPTMVNDLRNINTKEEYQLLINESQH